MHEVEECMFVYIAVETYSYITGVVSYGPVPVVAIAGLLTTPTIGAVVQEPVACDRSFD